MVAAERALAIGRQLGHEAIEVNARTLRASASASMCLREGHEELARCHADAVGLGQPILAWVAAFIATTSSEFRLDPRTAVDWAERELASGRHASAPGLRSALVNEKWLCLGPLGRLAEMEAMLPQVPPVFAGSGCLELWVGEFEGARTGLEAMVANALGGGNASGSTSMMVHRAALAERTGRIEEAERLYDEAHALVPETSSINLAWLAGLRKAILLARETRSEEARDLLSEVERASAGADDIAGIAGFLHLARAVVAGETSAADVHFDAAVTAFRRYSLPYYEAEVFEDWGRMTGRRQHLDAALEVYERLGVRDAWKERARQLRSTSDG